MKLLAPDSGGKICHSVSGKSWTRRTFFTMPFLLPLAMLAAPAPVVAQAHVGAHPPGIDLSLRLLPGDGSIEAGVGQTPWKIFLLLLPEEEKSVVVGGGEKPV